MQKRNRATAKFMHMCTCRLIYFPQKSFLLSFFITDIENTMNPYTHTVTHANKLSKQAEKIDYQHSNVVVIGFTFGDLFLLIVLLLLPLL